MSLLSVEHATVRYGATTALDAVDLALAAGEIHAVVGENGAGKSTLLRVLAGALVPDRGTVARAPATRVAWVAQEPELPPDGTAAEWIFLAAELRGRLGWLRTAAMRDAAAAALAAVGAAIDPSARLGALSASQRKQVQVARAVRQQAPVWLLDEPTAVLGAAEAERLFAVARGVAAAGGAVVWVSHRLDEVLALADRVTVLRDGRRVASGAAADFDAASLVRQMVGRDVALGARRAGTRGAPCLQVRGLAAGRLRDVAFAVRAGEIVGLAGLLGSGRSTVLESLAGVRRARIQADGHAVAVLLPEDRMRKGLIPTLGVRENLHLPAAGWRLQPSAERRATRDWIARLALRTPGVDAPIGALSGGNQQKVLLARALRRAPRLLLLDEPTAGVDVGAKADIHAQIRALADDGTAVLLASSDLPELLGLCDRILALYGGRVAAEFDAATVDEHALGAAITGQPTADRRQLIADS
ncbi:MAG: sugar ABC transporter ATP-binding protein [Deltaproteobacteria bacterium]|nr:sugar ABC transporter ATP-binding protein [Deltaproteobacteria bacterium]